MRYEYTSLFLASINSAKCNFDTIVGGETIQLSHRNTQTSTALLSTTDNAYKLCDLLNSSWDSAYSLANIHAIPFKYPDQDGYSIRILSTQRLFTGPKFMSYEDWEKIPLPMNYISDPLIMETSIISVPYSIMPNLENNDCFSLPFMIPDTVNRVILYVKILMDDFSKSHDRGGNLNLYVAWGNNSDYVYGNTLESIGTQHIKPGSIENIGSYSSGLNTFSPLNNKASWIKENNTIISLEPPPGSTVMRLFVTSGNPEKVALNIGDFEFSYMVPRLSIQAACGVR